MGCNTVLEFLSKNYLVELNISRNPIGIEGIEILSCGLRNKTLGLKSLNLSQTRLTDDGVLMIVDAMKSIDCLNKLNKLELKDNGLTTLSATYLSEILSNDNCKITTLDMSSNDLENEGANSNFWF